MCETDYYLGSFICGYLSTMSDDLPQSSLSKISQIELFSLCRLTSQQPLPSSAPYPRQPVYLQYGCRPPLADRLVGGLLETDDQAEVDISNR